MLGHDHRGCDFTALYASRLQTKYAEESSSRVRHPCSSFLDSSVPQRAGALFESSTPGCADADSCVTSKRGCFAFIPKYRTRGVLVGSQAIGGPHSRRTLSRLPPFAAPLSLPPSPFSFLLRRMNRVPQDLPTLTSSLFIDLPLVSSCSLLRQDKKSAKREKEEER